MRWFKWLLSKLEKLSTVLLPKLKWLYAKWEEESNRLSDKLHPYFAMLSKGVAGEDDDTKSNKNQWSEKDRQIFEDAAKKRRL